MKRTTRGLIAGLMLGTQALASGPSRPTEARTDAEGVPGVQRELSGRVLGASPGLLHIQSERGPAIPVRVTHATRVGGGRVPRARSVEAFLQELLPPGTSVRATFDVRTLTDGTPQNVASAIDTP
jgi:hypothetical protein